MTEPRYNRPLHLLALLTAAATFPLIFMGGLVTSHDAGLAVPDWPNSYGYNMFTFPPSKWIGGIWYEHVHRLYASGVGFLCILLVVTAFLTERGPDARRGVRRLAVAMLAAVIFQGVLGGLRVVLLELDLAIVHACFAQAFFCLAALTALVTSKWWMAAPDLSAGPERLAGRVLVRVAAAAVVVIYLQLIVGATMRHYKAGLAIPDLPLAYGKVLPSTSPEEIGAINGQRLLEGLDRVTAGQVWLHFGHRVGAVLVSAAVLLLVARVLRRHRDHRGLARAAWALLVLLAVQLTLGVFTVLYRKPADVASAHVAVGALVLVTSFVIAARAARLYSPATRRAAARVSGFEVIEPALAAAGTKDGGDAPGQLLPA